MREQSIGGWLADLASRSPTPGGGAVVGLCAATSAALVGMVTSYTMGPKWADRATRMRQLNEEAGRLRWDALDAAEHDAAAFAAVGAAYGLPRATAEDKALRRTAIQRALVQATRPPARGGRLAVRLVEIAQELVDSGNPNVLSDVAVASSTARAAIETAVVNIEINRTQIKDEAEVARLNSIVKELAEAVASAEWVMNAVREKLQ